MDSSAAKTAKRYCLIAGLSAGLLLSCVLAFNTAVDPYGMYRLIEVKGFNLHKPAIYHRTRLFKAYDVRRIKPSAIVLGTSRSHVGLRMSHEGWDPTATPRYNLAFDGATTKEMYFYLRHADAIHPTYACTEQCTSGFRSRTSFRDAVVNIATPRDPCRPEDSLKHQHADRKR